MDAASISAARALLPAWVVWAPAAAALAVAALTFLAARGVTHLALRPFRRLPPGAHWTERARVAWTARRVAFAAGSALATAGALVHVGGPLSLPPAPLAAVLRVVLQVAVAVAAGLAVERCVFPGPALRERLRSVAAWLVLLFPHYLVAITFAFAAPWTPGLPAAAALAAAALVLWLSAGGGFALGRRVGLVLPAPPRLAAALAAAVEGTGGAPPALYELPILSANAFALPFLRAVGATTGALRCLDDAALAAVLRHELSHLAEGRRMAWLRLVNAASLPLALVAGPALYARAHWLLAPALFGAAWLWLFTVRGLQRRLEARADEAAHVSAPDYARALEALHRQNLVPAVTGRRSTHPDLYDRLVAAGVTPEWPRPAPPPRRVAPALLLVLVVAGVTFAGTLANARLEAAAGRGPGTRLLALAVSHGAPDLADLGRERFEGGDLRAAATFYGAAEGLDPREPLYPAVGALALSLSGRCDEARAALRRAEAVGDEDDYVESVREEVDGCGAAPSGPGGERSPP